MARLRRGRRREGGAVAIEFALTMPYVILLITAMFGFFEAFLARSLLFEVARAATRTCMLRNTGGANIETCANSAATYVQTNVLHNACVGNGITVDVKTLTGPYSLAGRQNEKLVVVTASCTLTALMPITVSGIASMPYISN